MMSKSDRETKRQNIIEVLNQARAMELLAITQYMNQHYNLDDMDFGEFAAKIKLIAIDEMRHAEMFAERIKELGGEPTTDSAGKVIRNQDVETIFPFDTEEEDKAIDAYNEFLNVCRDNNDSISMKLFETIIDDEQVHLNYFDSISAHIEKMGKAYLARIAGTPSSSGLTPSGFVVSEN
jgi:bacterioferritin